MYISYYSRILLNYILVDFLEEKEDDRKCKKNGE